MVVEYEAGNFKVGPHGPHDSNLELSVLKV